MMIKLRYIYADLMLSLSYHLSGSLISSLEEINLLRQQILLTPLRPKLELRFRWEGLIDKIYWSLNLANISLNKREIIEILTIYTKKKLTPTQKDVLRYRYAFDYIYRDWSGSKKPLTSKTVLYLHELLAKGEIKTEASIKEVLDYLQTSTDHPVLQASIALIELMHLAPFTKGSAEVARLLAYIFLYKQGFDMRGMLVLEEYFRRDMKTYEEVMSRVTQDGNLTPWLEYVANGVILQLEKVKQKINEQAADGYLSAKAFELTERQQAILSVLDQPGSRITNKKVQKMFAISQITASRELAKLASIDLLFVHGKGRSVYYTKV